jgi:Rieske Fe-S protein
MSKTEQRRKFLAKMVWGIQAGIAAVLTALLTTASMLPVFSSRRSDWIPLVDLEELTDQPRPLALRFQQTQGWLTEDLSEAVYALIQNGNPVVFSSRCTHLGCAVHWESSNSRFQCPCHGGAYDLDGEVVVGPPPLPLRRLDAEVRDSKVWIRRT